MSAGQSSGQRRLLEIVALAEGLSEQRRRALFEQELGHAPELIDQAERLSRLVDEVTLAPEEMSESVASRRLPSIPGFELIELIGHGGMGSVYRARQLGPERDVAVKLLRADMISPAALDRMEREGQALARLSHPGIARVLAAGRTRVDDGPELSWLAMELIRGRRLDQYIAEERPDLRELLRLFERIGEAVQYAHQQGVIHRDLKPGNILIDEAGQPHVLDFGVARFLEVDPAQASTVLAAGEVVGTLGYMAPEQVDGRADTRSDVYAIGVMLYHALSGRLPLELEGLSLVDALAQVSRGRTPALRQRCPELPADLESLVMQALAPDPADRYPSASQLLEDIRRYLEHRPVLARPPGRWRSTVLFVRRHRLAVAAAFVVVVTIMTGAVVSAHFAWREVQARTEAEMRADQLGAVNRFIQDMLLAADPERTLGEKVTVVDTLSEAARMLPLDRQLAPAARAELQRTIGSVLLNLGRTEEGREQLELAWSTVRDHAGIDPVDRQRARMELARADLESGRIDQALAVFKDIDHQTSDWPPSRNLRYELANLLGRALIESGQIDQAAELVAHRLDEASRSLGDEHLLTLVLRNLSAVIAGRQGEPLREVEIQRDLLALRRSRFGQEHPQTLAAMNNLAHALSAAGQREEAERHARAALGARERVLGPAHPSTVVSRNNLAALYIQRGAIDEAEPLVRSVVAWNVERLGPLHPNTLSSRNILAYLLEEQGQLDEAERVYRAVLAAAEESGDDGLRSQMLGVGNNLAMLLLARGDAAAAVSEFEALLLEAERLLGAGHLNLAVFRANYGWSLHHFGRSEEAGRILEASLGQLRPALGEAHPRVTMTEERLALVRGP